MHTLPLCVKSEFWMQSRRVLIDRVGKFSPRVAEGVRVVSVVIIMRFVAVVAVRDGRAVSRGQSTVRSGTSARGTHTYTHLHTHTHTRIMQKARAAAKAGAAAADAPDLEATQRIALVVTARCHSAAVTRLTDRLVESHGFSRSKWMAQHKLAPTLSSSRGQGAAAVPPHGVAPPCVRETVVTLHRFDAAVDLAPTPTRVAAYTLQALLRADVVVLVVDGTKESCAALLRYVAPVLSVEGRCRTVRVLGCDASAPDVRNALDALRTALAEGSSDVAADVHPVAVSASDLGEAAAVCAAARDTWQGAAVSADASSTTAALMPAVAADSVQGNDGYDASLVCRVVAVAPLASGAALLVDVVSGTLRSSSKLAFPHVDTIVCVAGLRAFGGRRVRTASAGTLVSVAATPSVAVSKRALRRFAAGCVAGAALPTATEVAAGAPQSCPRVWPRLCVAAAVTVRGGGEMPSTVAAPGGLATLVCSTAVCTAAVATEADTASPASGVLRFAVRDDRCRTHARATSVLGSLSAAPDHRGSGEQRALLIAADCQSRGLRLVTIREVWDRFAAHQVLFDAATTAAAERQREAAAAAAAASSTQRAPAPRAATLWSTLTRLVSPAPSVDDSTDPAIVPGVPPQPTPAERASTARARVVTALDLLHALRCGPEECALPRSEGGGAERTVPLATDIALDSTATNHDAGAGASRLVQALLSDTEARSVVAAELLFDPCTRQTTHSNAFAAAHATLVVPPHFDPAEFNNADAQRAVVARVRARRDFVTPSYVLPRALWTRNTGRLVAGDTPQGHRATAELGHVRGWYDAAALPPTLLSLVTRCRPRLAGPALALVAGRYAQPVKAGTRFDPPRNRNDTHRNTGVCRHADTEARVLAACSGLSALQKAALDAYLRVSRRTHEQRGALHRAATTVPSRDAQRQQRFDACGGDGRPDVALRCLYRFQAAVVAALPRVTSAATRGEVQRVVKWVASLAWTLEAPLMCVPVTALLDRSNQAADSYWGWLHDAVGINAHKAGLLPPLGYPRWFLMQLCLGHWFDAKHAAANAAGAGCYSAQRFSTLHADLSGRRVHVIIATRRLFWLSLLAVAGGSWQRLPRAVWDLVADALDGSDVAALHACGWFEPRLRGGVPLGG